MLTLTPNAAEAVRIVTSQFGAAGIRISSPPETAPGEYALDLVSGPNEFDVLVHDDGARVYLDLLTSIELDALTLDARINDDGAPEFGVVDV